MTSVPFQVARGIGNNLESGFREAKEQNAIDSILSEAMNSGDPAVLQQSIGKILSQVRPENQKNAIQVLDNKLTSLKDASTNKAKAEAALKGGYDVNAPAGVQTVQAKNKLDQQAREQFFGGGQQSTQPGMMPKDGQPQGIQPNAEQPQQVQQPTQQQNLVNPFANKSHDELIAGTTSSQGFIRQGSLSELKAREERDKITQKLSSEKRKVYESDRNYHSKTSQPIVSEANEALREESSQRGIDAQLK